MAQFANQQAAEARYKSQIANKVWVTAHDARDFNGNIIVRFIRYMSGPLDGATQKGGWVETNDDSVS